MKMLPSRKPPSPTRQEWVRFWVLFGLTFLSVFVSYGWWWSGGDPFTDGQAFSDSMLFAFGLMGILGAHEAGHYIVARRHGMDQTLPFFIPFPLAFGTLGAIIRLRSPPRTRSALLEMGAAGPLAGFAVALVVLGLGLPGTTGHEMPEVTLQWPPPVPEEPGAVLAALGAVLSSLAALLPEVEAVDGLPLTIMANPPVMDLLGMMVLGEAPGRYDELTPLGLAGWAGCFLTAMNLLPIGQLDGGHVLRAIAPDVAEVVARVGLVIVALAGFVYWPGWTVWAVLLWTMGAWRGLPASGLEAPTTRALCVAALTAITLALCFMPTPIETETIPWSDIRVLDQNGRLVPSEELTEWWENSQVSH